MIKSDKDKSENTIVRNYIYLAIGVACMMHRYRVFNNGNS